MMEREHTLRGRIKHWLALVLYYWLVFSTLHTNDAAGTISRFTEMGVEPFMISASLLCVCAQRLMRRVCSNCKQEYTPSDAEARLLELETYKNEKIYKANSKGCDK